MKKLISLVVAIAMLMSMSAVVLAAGTTTLYCNAPSTWSKCYVYWWGSSQSNPTWPGEPMTKDSNGVWAYNVPSDAANVIFTNGSGAQSADLPMPTGNKVQFNYVDKEWVTVGTQGAELTLIKVYVDTAATGLTGTPNAYIWDCASANSWPGVAMTHVEGNIYCIEVFSDTKNIIFNDGTNQTADLVVPADKALWNGSAWTTYTAAPAPITYNLTAGVKQTITIPAAGSAIVVVNATSSDMILNVNGNRMYYDWQVEVGKVSGGPGPSGAFETQLPSGSKYSVTIKNISSESEQVLDVTASVPPVGTMDNPEQLIIGKNTAAVEANSWGYFYTWTATEDGKLTVAVDTAASGDWNYCINIPGAGRYGDTHAYNDSPVVSSETVTVEAGDTVQIVVGSVSYGAAKVVLNVSFVAGQGQGGGTDSTPGSSKDNPIKLSSPWNYIEAGATVWFLYDDSADALANGIFSQLLNVHSSASYTVVYGGQSLPVDTDGYVNSEIASNDYSGKYLIAITNNSDEKAFFTINVTDKPAYVISGDYVYVGQNDLTLDPSAEYTLWEFEPTETGIYVLTLANKNGLIGNWGASWYPQDTTENKTYTLEWTCTGVGQSIMVGVAGVDSTVLTITLKGAYTPDDEMDWTYYENEQLNTEYVPEGELVAIDVTDDLPDEIWVGEDGFIRYGSEFGPIVVADLSDCSVNFVEAATNGQLRFYVYLDGVLVAKIDVNDAMTEYVEAGVTPLTEELAFMLQMLGEKNGWYDQSIPGFYLWAEDGIEVNPDEAWLFACYTVSGTELEEPEVILSDYIVAGSSGLCGSEWDPADEANRMVDNGDGTYTIVFENIAVGTYEFKITKGSWDENWGLGGVNGGNVTANVETAGNVIITFNPETGEITVNNVEVVPGTGDEAVTGLVFVVALAAMGVVALVCTKKKFF